MIQIRKKNGEVIDVESDVPLDAADLAELAGREEDPLVRALVSEIRRLGSVLGQQQSASVNVAASPIPPAPNVSVYPQINLTPTEQLRLDVIERDYKGYAKSMTLTVIK